MQSVPKILGVYNRPRVSGIQVSRAESPAEIEAFVGLPYSLHRASPQFTPLLRRDVRLLLDPCRNPFFAHAERELFVARRAGKVVGRVAAIVDRLHEETHRDGAGFFGFIESIDDAAVARELLAAAAGHVAARGKRVLRGPLSPSINDEAGLLVSGFDSPAVLMMGWNPEHYPALVEACGFRKCKDLLTFEREGGDLPPRLAAATRIVEHRQGVRCRALELRRFDAEVALVKRLFNAGWARNWGAVPLTDAEVAQLAAQLRPIVVPELVVFAEHRGEPIGFAAAVPDLNVALRANPSGRTFPGLLKVLWAARRVRRLRVLLLGVLPEWQGRGVDALLYRRIWENASARGFDWAEAGWVLEDNHAMINGLARMGFRLHKTYRIYERAW
jgi:GNAT superfamily N-acetyltransferase